MGQGHNDKDQRLSDGAATILVREFEGRDWVPVATYHMEIHHLSERLRLAHELVASLERSNESLQQQHDDMCHAVRTIRKFVKDMS